jgi:hypothetical protein
MSRIDCRHWKISTGRHFQNGRHNTANIQHCPISSKFEKCMKCRWNRTMLNFCGIVVAILKMETVIICSMSGINSGHHNLPTYEISLKSNNVESNSTLFDFNVLNWFPTLKNFYRSPFSKWPPLYRKNSTLFDFKGNFSTFP